MSTGRLIKFTLRAARRGDHTRGATITLDPTSDKARELLKDGGWDHVFVTGTVPVKAPPPGTEPVGGFAPAVAALHRGLLRALAEHGDRVAALPAEQRLHYAILLRDNGEAFFAALKGAVAAAELEAFGDEVKMPTIFVEEAHRERAAEAGAAAAARAARAAAEAEAEAQALADAAEAKARAAEEAAIVAAKEAAASDAAARAAEEAASAPPGTVEEALVALRAALANPEKIGRDAAIALGKAAGLPVPGRLYKLNKADAIDALAELLAGSTGGA